ncbi:hypothetical protein [Heyndrickxia sporothermodurans]|uniref:hypothetical protein n=1 Tax=Heyndrickxia sporothermodurans TaxID=46224 RepID=UPI0008256D76|nr:hypothetical protein [Heyndrickxia sporothermodurans]
MRQMRKVRRKYFCLFESKIEDELIFVHFEDLDGYIHYEYCNDGTKQVYRMTERQMYNEYKRLEL